MTRRALLVLALAGTAHAQPAQLTAEFQAGVDAYRLGTYDEARKHLEAARELDPKLPGPHRFLAAVAQAEGKWDDCITSARTAMELNPRSSEIADTRKLHDDCRAAAGRAPYRGELGDSAAVAVTTNIPGATVKINGLTYGGTPMAPRLITAGTLDIEITKPGWKPATRTINALAGIVTDVAVDLEADAVAQSPNDLVTTAPPGKKLPRLRIIAPPGSSVTIDGMPQSAMEMEAGTHVVEVRLPEHDTWRRRVRIETQSRTIAAQLVVTGEREARRRRGLIMLGAGGALLAGGLGAALVSRDAASEARDIVRVERARDPALPLAETALIAPVRTRADLDDARDRASRWGLVSTLSYGAGLVAAGIGAYALYGARQPSDSPPAFAIAPLRGGALIAKELAW